jgi:ribosomal protein S18 acetylase RimI-like enzyme
LRSEASALTPAAATQARVSPMGYNEADQLGLLFGQVLRALPYYNQRAQASELAKYSSDELRELVLADPGSVLVAKIGQRLAGFCVSREDDMLVWLSWIGVHPECRRKGIASALLGALDERARALGAHKIWCDSRTNNELSKTVLAAYGYRQICTIRNHWYGQDFILWEKSVV